MPEFPYYHKLLGGTTILGAGPTQITTSVDIPCRQFVMRAEPNALGVIYFGNSDVAADNAVGYFYARETAGWGPLAVGSGIYPHTVYLLGYPGTKIYWWAFPA